MRTNLPLSGLMLAWACATSWLLPEINRLSNVIRCGCYRDILCALRMQTVPTTVTSARQAATVDVRNFT